MNMAGRHRIGSEALWQSGVILVISVVLGLVVNHVRANRLEIFGDCSQLARSIMDYGDNLAISFDEAQRLFLSRKAIFLDARSRELFQWGHIPGALNLPLQAFDEYFERVMAEIPEDAMIITYCNGKGCGLSKELALSLIDKGYRNVHVLTDGWSLWEAHDFPIETGDRPGRE